MILLSDVGPSHPSRPTSSPMKNTLPEQVRNFVDYGGGVLVDEGGYPLAFAEHLLSIRDAASPMIKRRREMAKRYATTMDAISINMQQM